MKNHELDATNSASAVAHSNIAFLKYWGNINSALRLPYNASLSMNLSEAHTTTTVRFDPGLAHDHLSIDGARHIGPALDRVSRHLDIVRARSGLEMRAEVLSSNSFPMGTGIASSASAFAALSVAASAAAGLDLSEAELSALARRGSGSASRSIPDGFTEWHAAGRDEASFAESFASSDHWDLHDIVAIISDEHKALGSTNGHDAALESPFFEARLKGVDAMFKEMRQAILDRDLAVLGPAMEADALALHAIAMTGRPSALYWSGGTMELLKQVRAWRAEGLEVYFTLDAGPNVHLICEAGHAAQLEEAVKALDFVISTLHNRPAGPARRVDTEAVA